VARPGERTPAQLSGFLLPQVLAPLRRFAVVGQPDWSADRAATPPILQVRVRSFWRKRIRRFWGSWHIRLERRGRGFRRPIARWRFTGRTWPTRSTIPPVLSAEILLRQR